MSDETIANRNDGLSNRKNGWIFLYWMGKNKGRQTKKQQKDSDGSHDDHQQANKQEQAKQKCDVKSYNSPHWLDKPGIMSMIVGHKQKTTLSKMGGRMQNRKPQMVLAGENSWGKWELSISSNTTIN